MSQIRHEDGNPHPREFERVFREAKEERQSKNVDMYILVFMTLLSTIYSFNIHTCRARQATKLHENFKVC